MVAMLGFPCSTGARNDILNCIRPSVSLVTFYQSLRSVRPIFLYSLLGAIVPRSAMLVLLVVLPRYVDLDYYGSFVLVITFNEIVEMSATNWCRLLLYRRIIRDRPIAESGRAVVLRGYRSNPYVRIAAGTTLLSALLASAVGVVLSPEHAGLFGPAVAAAVLATAVNRIVLFVLQALERQIDIGRIEAIRGVAFGAFCLLGACVTTHIFSALMMSVALSVIVSLCLSWKAVLASNAGLEIIQDKDLEVKSLGLPLAIGQAANFAFGWIDRLLLGFYLGPVPAGFYGLASSLGRQPVEVVMSAMNAQTSPILMAHDLVLKETQEDVLRGSLVALVVLAAGGSIGLIAVCA